jgi:uncharacterized protein YneR
MKSPQNQTYKGEALMHILDELQLESNNKIKINFNGGDLSSDAGLIPVNEFARKIGFDKLIHSKFKTNDTASFRYHTDTENLMQKIYQTVAAYFQDDDADELTHDPVFNAILGKKELASQPTMSRFINRCDEICLMQFEQIQQILRKRIYSIKRPEQILIDIDSTLFATYGKQEGNDYNQHYSNYGYHPLLAYDGLTGDLLKAELRPGNFYTSKNATDFVYPLLLEFQDDYPTTDIYLRGDSGFADVMLYEKLESNGVSYAIRLKESRPLRDAAADYFIELCELTKDNQVDYAVVYGEFFYKADSWLYPRRVAVKVEKPYGQLTHLYTFIVTNMESKPEDIIRFYCNRGTMENFIKESKSGFHMDAMSSHSMTVNSNKLQISVLAYNLFNWFRRLVLPAKMRKLRIDTIRLKLIKIAARITRSARYITFKLCSSCPYQKEFYEIFQNIRLLPKLE